MLPSIFRFSQRLACSCLLAMMLATSSFAYDKAKLFDAFLSIVMIKGYTTDGSMAYGSGVVIAQNKVLTNCHIMRQTKEPWVARGEDTFSITGVKADRYHDLCLVSVENLTLKPAVMGSIQQLSKGAPIVSIGHSSANPSPLTGIGKVRAVYPFDDGLIISGTARFSMGASGSGMFDEQGKLIGINTFKSPGRNAYFYALPIEWLARVEQLPEEKTFPITGKTFWEENENDKPFFMRVVQPELNNQWPALQDVALQWSKAEPNNSEAWYELAYAYEMNGDTITAKQYYQRALKINAQHTEAMYRLGIMAALSGDEVSLAGYQKSLALLDVDLAETLAKQAACKSQCEAR